MVPTRTKPGRRTNPVRRRRSDHEFLPAALQIIETPLSPVRTTMIATICGLAVAVVAWSYIGRVDIIATAQGKIQPIGRTKTIQPLETGKVISVAVENGQRVAAGETLLELDAGEARADEATLTSDLRSLRAEALRRRLALAAAETRMAPTLPTTWSADTPADVAEREQRVLVGDIGQLDTTIASYEAQRAQKSAERDSLAATIASQEVLLDTMKQRVDMRTELFGRNSESRASVIDALEVYQQAQTTLAGQKGQLSQTVAGLSLVERDIDKTYAAFRADNAQKLADVERQIGGDSEKLAKAMLKTGHMRLKSPIDGVVQGLTVTTTGQVVSTGEQIMQIVPGGAALEIECYLPNADVGFVAAGQAAVVKVESFPFTDYGTLAARVVRVAQDSIPQIDAEQREQNPSQSQKGGLFGGGQRTQNLVYAVTLALEQPTIRVNDASIALVPGMAVTVEIKTGSRRILSYLFSPLVRVITTAMKER